MNRAWIIIDCQNDFLMPEGVLYTEEATDEVLGAIQLVIEAARKFNDAIYYTQDTHDENYFCTQEGHKLPIPHCMYGSWGWRIVDSLDTKETAYNNVHHLYKGAFAYDNWEDEHLDQYDEISVCGVVSSICVIANIIAIKALWPELPIKFLAYASAGLSSENHAAAIEVLRSLQVEVIE